MLRLTILLLLVLAAPAAAKPGDLDRGFANRGRLAFAGGPGYTSASDVAIRADGSLLVAGNGQEKVSENWLEASTLATLTNRGRLERRTVLSAPPRGPFYTNPATQTLALLPDGAALIAATLDWQSHPRVAIFRVNADGTPDPGFGTNGVASAGEELYLSGLGVDGSGRIVLAATRSRGDTAVVMRLLPDGALDARYGVTSLTGSAGALLVRRDGSAFVATTRGKRGKRASVSVHKLDPAGRRVRSSRLILHDTSGFQANAAALAPGPRGSLLIAGNDARRHTYGWLARLRADGSIDRRFARRTLESKTHDVSIADIARDRRDRIVLAGSRSHYDVPRTLVARLTPSGKRDRRFGPDGTVLLQIGSRAKTRLIASEANAVAVDARDRIVLAGAAYDDDAAIREDLGRSNFAVARLKG
jgi:uncharacterized delta-60 repeat protein